GNAPEVASDNKSRSSSNASLGSTAKRTTRNYELDKTISHTRSPVGTLNRLSVAVVVNHKKQVNDQGDVTWLEHSPEELNQFEQLVKEAIGFNAMRGDTVNVMNARFNQPEVVEPLPATPIWQEPWVWDAAKQVLGGMLVLFIVFGMLRPALKNIMSKDMMVPQGALAGGGQLNAEQQQVTQQMKEMKALEAAPEYDKSIHNVKEMVTADPKLAAQVVRNWVGEE
ncbi:MAG: flagellar M-ring protein FliF C-terminal domain-containing protein, partial [Gammaproteobacteria bacterium]